MMGYPAIGCSVLRTYGARQRPSKRCSHPRVRIPLEAPSGGATPGRTDAGAGGEGTRATAVLRHEVRTGRASHRPRRLAAVRKALPQTDLVLPAAQGNRWAAGAMTSFKTAWASGDGVLRVNVGEVRASGLARRGSRRSAGH